MRQRRRAKQAAPVQARTSGDVRRRQYPATVAKNKFAMILDDVMQGREVFITRHNAPKAVVISVEKFNELSKASSPDLTALTAEFDARLERMQQAKQRKAMDAAFEASADELGRSALKASRSR